jgi:hypothetical protein
MALMRASPRAIPADRWCVAAAFLLLAIAMARIVAASTTFNATVDETVHLSSGLEWLDRGRYTADPEHPPVARILSALGPYLAGEHWRAPASPLAGDPLLGMQPHYDRMLLLGRLGILPFFGIAGAFVFLWARHIGGAFAGLMAIAFFSTTPAILAHAGLITTDMAVTAFITAAVYCSIRWLSRPNRRNTVILGVTIGLAIASKFSALVFLPAAWLTMYAAYRLKGFPRLREKDLRQAMRTVPLALSVAILLVWAAYRFTFGHTGILELRLPAPRFFMGLKMLWEHNQRGHGAYLFGRRSLFGFWYFFPSVLAIKTPLAMLGLSGWAAFCCLRWGKARAILPLAFSFGILLVSMTSSINIGVRHILPVYCGLAVVCGTLAAGEFSAARDRPIAAAAVLLLLLWHVVSSGVAHPDYLAYTNELAGSTPENILADSDLDWAQDMKRLGTYLHGVGAKEVTFMPFSPNYAAADPDFPRILPMDPASPAPGWNAVSISVWKLARFRASGPVWPDREKVQIRIGRGILLWHFPPPAN